MKLAIVGSRDYHNYITIKSAVDQIRKHVEVTEIVSGGAPGVDALAKRYAEEEKIKYVEFPADWKSYGKAAGPMRNQQIVDYCDKVVAFPADHSPGTNDTIKRATNVEKLLATIKVN
jgi:hypothetical protein